jgi:hypothetical protein
MDPCFMTSEILRSIVFMTTAIQMLLADAQVYLLMKHTELFFFTHLADFF